jgi:flagellum-specific peptidoglycan hydrolase FlgJ
VREVLIPIAYNHVGSACHSGVYGVLSKDKAKFRVYGSRREAANDVAGINVLNRRFFPTFGKVLGVAKSKDPWNAVAKHQCSDN